VKRGIENDLSKGLRHTDTHTTKDNAKLDHMHALSLQSLYARFNFLLAWLLLFLLTTRPHTLPHYGPKCLCFPAQTLFFPFYFHPSISILLFPLRRLIRLGCDIERKHDGQRNGHTNRSGDEELQPRRITNASSYLIHRGEVIGNQRGRGDGGGHSA